VVAEPAEPLHARVRELLGAVMPPPRAQDPVPGPQSVRPMPLAS
jgi:hypothetical protein